MGYIALVLAALLAQASTGDAADLVKRLGAGKYSEREAASAGLEKLGAKALPALRVAVENRDLEVRGRASALLARIEAAVLTQASMVRIDVENQALDDVFTTIAERGLNRLAWHPRAPKEAQGQRVSLQMREPIPFWQAVDQLCAAGGLRYITAMSDGTAEFREPMFRLFLAPGKDHALRADDGPLRLELIGVRQSRQVDLVPNLPGFDHPERRGPPPAFGHREAELVFQLRLVTEPRLLVQRVGDIHVIEAIDDQGGSLLPEGKPSRHFGGGNYPTPQVGARPQIVLRSPPRSVKAIKRLRLTMPVEVVSRRPDPLVISIEDAQEKPFRHGKTSLQVLGVRNNNTPFLPVLTLSLRSDETASDDLATGFADDPNRGGTHPVQPDVTGNVFQVFDERGRMFPWYGGPNVTRMPDGGIQVELPLDGYGRNPVPDPAPGGLVRRERPAAVPAVIHHYDYTRQVVRAVFEYRDIPFPRPEPRP